MTRWQHIYEHFNKLHVVDTVAKTTKYN